MSRLAGWGQATLSRATYNGGIPRCQRFAAASQPTAQRWYSDRASDEDDDLLDFLDEAEAGPSKASSSSSPSSSTSAGPKRPSKTAPPDGFDLLRAHFDVENPGLYRQREYGKEEEEVNLSLLRKLRPDPRNIRKKFRGDREKEHEGMQRRMWAKSNERVAHTFNIPQLRSLAKQAGLPKEVIHAPKLEIVAALVESVFGVHPPRSVKMDEQEEDNRRIFMREHEVPQADLFLLLADSGSKLSQIAGTFGTRLTPKVMTDARGRNVYKIVATGYVSQVGLPIERALKSASELKISHRVTLQLPRTALDPKTIRYIASRTGCFIEYSTAPSSTSSPHETSLDLYAFSPSALTYAQICLAAFQADLYQGARPLLSFAQPSHLDPDYKEAGGEQAGVAGTRESYCFHPHALASPQSWLTQLTAGGNATQMYRLGRLRGSRGGGLFGGRGRAPASSTPSTLVELETGGPLGGERNWSWLEEHMDASKLDLAASASAPVTTSHSITTGTLAFSAPQAAPEDVGSILGRLASLLAPPLGGSWPLDTAYQWLRNRDPTAPFERRPLWVSGQMNGAAADLEGSMSKEIEKVLLNEPQEEAAKAEAEQAEQVEGGNEDASAARNVDTAKQQELLRFTYRMHATESDDIEHIHRLIIDVEEAEVPGAAQTAVAAAAARSEQKADTAAAGKAPGDAAPFEPFTYRVASARLVTTREADVLAPEHGCDLRLATQKERSLSAEELEAVETGLRSYLDKLHLSVGKSVLKRMERRAKQGSGGGVTGEEDSLEQDHPRLHTPPAPLHAFYHPEPPMSLQLQGVAPLRAAGGEEVMACSFELAERVHEASWPLKLEGEMGEAELMAEGEQQAEADQPSATSRPRLVSTTSVSDLTGRPRTTTSIVWSQESGKESEETGWKDRVDYAAKMLLQAGARR